MKFLDSFNATYHTIFHDSTVLVTLFVAIIFYSFFYPAAYRSQIVAHLPIVVVDLDDSSFSRMLVRKISAVQGVSLQGMVKTFSDARKMLSEDQIDGIVLISSGFEQDILKGGQGKVAVYANGAYTLRSKAVFQSINGAISAMQVEASRRQALMQGVPAKPSLVFVQRPLFNTREGYGSAIVPGVAILIIHQTLLLGISLILGTRKEHGIVHSPLPEFLGMTCAFILKGCLNALYFLGFVFWFQDYPVGENFFLLMFVNVIFVSAVVAFSLFVGSFFNKREQSMQLLLGTSIPFFFLSGLSWPISSFPKALSWLCMAIPSTPGIQLMIKINQMGAHFAEVKKELLILMVMIVVYGAMAWIRNCGGGESMNRMNDSTMPVGDGLGDLDGTSPTLEYAGE